MPEKRKSVQAGSNQVATSNRSKKSKTSDSRSTSIFATAPPATSSVAYDPVHFIRSHSKNNDPADIQTQIWDVVFEPDTEDPSKTTLNVATCGGNAICIINVLTGIVGMKYRHKELKETFYTLAWTTLTLGTEKVSILASGGIRGEIRLFHPKNKVCFHDWRPVEKKSVAVNSLIFHSSRTSWLFCGTSDGIISLWDIGIPSLPSYDGIDPVKLLRLFPDYGDVYNISWTGSVSNWLLAGTAAGLVGYHIEEDKIERISTNGSGATASDATSNYKPRLHDFIMPENKRDDGENPIVDSLATLSDWLIVNKCALHGLIYVWDLKKTLAQQETCGDDPKSATDDGSVVELNVSMTRNLTWSDTDNFYMNLGCHKENGLIACGDDKGTIWLYDQKTVIDAHKPPSDVDKCSKGSSISDSVKAGDKISINPTPMPPDARLAWPELQDDMLEFSRKVTLDKQKNNIIVDKVATSHDSGFVVAVTSNNMVCIWQRSASSKSSDGATSSSQTCADD